MQALMKLSRGNATPRTVNWSEENFSPPPVASLISGFRNADVSPPTTLANAAPITTPTAISTTLPRRMNFLNPSSIDTSRTDCPQMYDRKASRSSPAGRLGYLGKCNLERDQFRSASALQYSGTYNHRPRPAAAAPPIANPSTPAAPHPFLRPSKSRPGTAH